MKRVFIEMQKMSNLNSGLGQFCLHFGNALSEIAYEKVKPTFFVPKHFKGIFGPEFDYKSVSIFHKLFSPSSKDQSLWHCVHQLSPYLPASKNTKLLLTIHDLNFLEKYSANSKKQRIKDKIQQKVDRANTVVAISNYTAGLVKEHLSIDAKKIKVIHNGNSLNTFLSPVKPDFLPNGEFLFTIGIISAKKNFKTLVPLLKGNNFNLVIAGENKNSYAAEIRTLAETLNVSERVFMPGPVKEETKFWLYQNCKAFVFPSLTEGFGLPVIEAMSQGKPVFLSDKTSLPEIGGKEAFFWKNFDEVEMQNVLEQGLKDYETDPLKKERIISWSKQFTWENAATQYLDLYLSLLE